MGEDIPSGSCRVPAARTAAQPAVVAPHPVPGDRRRHRRRGRDGTVRTGRILAAPEGAALRVGRSRGSPSDAACDRCRDGQDSRRRAGAARRAHQRSQPAGHADSAAHHALSLGTGDAAVRAGQVASIRHQHGRELAVDPDATACLCHAEYPHRVTRRRGLAARAPRPVHRWRSRQCPVHRASRGAAKGHSTVSISRTRRYRPLARRSTAEIRRSLDDFGQPDLDGSIS
jgi:hypothetical protein